LVTGIGGDGIVEENGDANAVFGKNPEAFYIIVPFPVKKSRDHERAEAKRGALKFCRSYSFPFLAWFGGLPLAPTGQNVYNRRFQPADSHAPSPS
jgi:hypothetical protein